MIEVWLAESSRVRRIDPEKCGNLDLVKEYVELFCRFLG